MNNKKITIQQPSIPTYRKPLYEYLNQKIHIILYYGKDGIPTDLPESIEKKYFSLKVLKFSTVFIKWHSAQLAAINKKSAVAILSWDIQYISLWLALLKSKISGIPIILWGHGYSKNESLLKQKIRNIPAFFSNAILLYDFHTAENLKKINQLRNKTFVAPNSLDQTKIKTAKNNWLSHPEKLEHFKIDKNLNSTFNIIYIGRIYEQNNLELLFQALSLLIVEIPHIKLILIGKENDYVGKLKIFADDLEISDHLIWTGAIYDEIKVAPWMLSSNFFCYPSNIGLSIMHAFGYGLPVITDDDMKSHNPEIWALENNKNGLLYKKNDFKDLAIKISLLYKDKKFRKLLAKNALSTVENKFTIQKMAEGFLNAIEYCLKK